MDEHKIMYVHAVKSQVEEAMRIYNESVVKSDKKYHDTTNHALDVNIEERQQARKLYDKTIASIRRWGR